MRLNAKLRNIWNSIINVFKQQSEKRGFSIRRKLRMQDLEFLSLPCLKKNNHFDLLIVNTMTLSAFKIKLQETWIEHIFLTVHRPFELFLLIIWLSVY